MSVLDWLLGRRESAPDDDVIRRISRELEAMEPGLARYLALFAFLLARVANVDQEVSAEEVREMERLVEATGGLSQAQAALVVEVAKSQNRLFGGTQNFLAAREFRDAATPEQKSALLHCLFAVSAADGTITIPEEETIRAISRELLLTNEEYLVIRSAYREKRSVFQR
jgi:uncharacterized tellurite resistance protein B-like protein